MTSILQLLLSQVLRQLLVVKINRVYDVKLDEVFTTEFNNGKEVIDIKCVPVEFVSDEAPVQRIGKKADAE